MLEKIDKFNPEQSAKLIILAANSKMDLQVALLGLLNKCKNEVDLLQLMLASLDTYIHAWQAGAICCAFVVSDHVQLVKEIETILKNLEMIFAERKTFKTINGSYLTTAPLGAKARIAFVYPGMGSAYPDVMRQLLGCFPSLWHDFIGITDRQPQRFIKPQLFYPGSLLQSYQQWQMQTQIELNNDFLGLCAASISYSWLFTRLISSVFGLSANMAFGYSIGEISMVAAQNIWQEPINLLNSIETSATFKTHLTGQMLAVKNEWAIHLNTANKELWSTYIIKCPAEQIIKELTEFSRIYLMAIHTPQEIMIGGCSLQCKTLIKKLKLNAINIPYKTALHTTPARQEFVKLKRIFSLPVQHAESQLYFNLSKRPAEVTSENIAFMLANTCCNTIDFPALVLQTYADGARIFVETGARDNCSYWISKILSNKPHLTVPLNVKGLDEWSCLVKGLAALIAHGIRLNLTPLKRLFNLQLTT